MILVKIMMIDRWLLLLRSESTVYSHWPAALFLYSDPSRRLSPSVGIKPCCFICMLCQEKTNSVEPASRALGRWTPKDRRENTPPLQRRFLDVKQSRALEQDMANDSITNPHRRQEASDNHLVLTMLFRSKICSDRNAELLDCRTAEERYDDGNVYFLIE